MTKDRGPYITTFTGRQWHFLDPSVADVCIEDIAHSLAQQTRFTGHLRLPYTTAEHSIHVSRLCEPEDALSGLLHDGGEAYLSDIARPIKHSLQLESYVKFERQSQACVYRAFNLPPDKPESVEVADKLMLGIEARDLMHPIVLRDPGWLQWIDPVRDHPLSVKAPWDHRQAELEFLLRYYELTYNTGKRQSEKEK